MAELKHEPKPLEQGDAGRGVRQGETKSLLAVIALSGLMMVAEIVGAIYSGSLALLSDGVHMFGHVGAAILSYGAIFLAMREAPAEKTYRYWRLEVLAALANALLLLPLAAFLIYESLRRWHENQPVELLAMTGIGAAGLAVNVACAGILHRHSGQSLNVRSAYLHMVADAASSIAVVLAAVLIFATGSTVFDLGAAVLISGLITLWSVRLMRESCSILLESAPRGIRIDEIRQEILRVGDVQEVHDIHVWAITSRMYSLTAHLVLGRDLIVSETVRLVDEINARLDQRFDITHTCFQFELQDRKPTRRLRRT